MLLPNFHLFRLREGAKKASCFPHDVVEKAKRLIDGKPYESEKSSAKRRRATAIYRFSKDSVTGQRKP